MSATNENTPKQKVDSFTSIFSGSQMLVNLPSEKQAMHLLHIFEEANSEYHWYLRQRFRDRIRQTYSQPTSHVDDRNWFCQLSLVLTLGQALRKEPKQESGEINDQWDINQSSAPLDLFGQALSLFTISEALTLENLEISNLMVSESFWFRGCSKFN